MTKGDYSRSWRWPANLPRLFSLLLLCFLLVASCSNQLHQFTDEDQEITLRVTAGSTTETAFSQTNRTVTIPLSFSADRNGTYRVTHGTSCDNTQITSGNGAYGAMSRDTTVAITISVNLDLVATNGTSITLCVQDTGGYKKASNTLSIQAYLEAINTLGGGGGVNLDIPRTAEFHVFQNDWVTGGENRGAGAAGPWAGNGIDGAYAHAAYVDPNDGYRLKYFVADRDNHRILIFNNVPASAAATADLAVGQANLTTGGVAAANAGGIIGQAGFDQPVYVAVSGTGALIVTDLMNNRVLVFNQIPTASGATANIVIGQPGFTTGTVNNGSLLSAARLNNPRAAAVIRGKLYIVDQANNRILVFNALPTTNGASADYAIGQADLNTTTSGTDYTSQSNYLNSPYDVFAWQDRLYVADGGNHRVLVYTTIPTGADARPAFVIGHSGPGFSLANRGTTTAINSLNQPRSIAAQGNKLAIADQGNNRILFFDLPINADDPNATHVLGQTNFTNAVAATTQTNFSTVKGLIFDNGYIWAADRVNNRVKVMQLPY